MRAHHDRANIGERRLKLVEFTAVRLKSPTLGVPSALGRLLEALVGF